MRILMRLSQHMLETWQGTYTVTLPNLCQVVDKNDHEEKFEEVEDQEVGECIIILETYS